MNRHQRREKAARERKEGFRLDKPLMGSFDEVPPVLRYSSFLRKLRREGNDAAARDLEREKELYGAVCPVHGELHDPIIGVLGDPKRVAFGCPHCSAPAILAAWEKEGADA